MPLAISQLVPRLAVGRHPAPATSSLVGRPPQRRPAPTSCSTSCGGFVASSPSGRSPCRARGCASVPSRPGGTGGVVGYRDPVGSSFAGGTWTRRTVRGWPSDDDSATWRPWRRRSASSPPPGRRLPRCREMDSSGPWCRPGETRNKELV